MKRIAFACVLLLVVAAGFATTAHDALYWKRRVLASLYSPANLPASYYGPTETIEGVEGGPSPPRVSAQDERLDPAALEAAAAYAGEQKSSALIVGRHGHIVFEKYWGDSGFDTVVDTGAFNAALTAIMVGVAMADRKIALAAEPVGNYIESFQQSDYASITLDDLLHMASGLGSDQRDARLIPDIRSECLGRTLASQGTKKWQPQACDPQLLAHIIERVSGQQYAAYISDRLWKPIGAADATLMLDREGGTAHASCCLRARQGDWMRIGEMLANDGKFAGEQILPPGWVRSMLTPAPGQPRFGYQVWRGAPFKADEGASEPYAADDLFLLKGPGKTRLWIVPSLRLTILRVGRNNESDAGWDDARIPNLILRGASDFVPKPGARDLSNLVPNH